MPTLLAACVVSALRPDASSVGITAIDKRPVDGPIKVGRYGLRADVQADRKHHGGLDQAVYMYSQADADFWATELDRDLPAGWFGENLRIDGLDVNECRVGERWRIGTAEFEAVSARMPCQTFARWVGGTDATGWVKRFTVAARPGTYFRVLKNGTVRSGDAVEVLHVPENAPTIRETFLV